MSEVKRLQQELAMTKSKLHSASEMISKMPSEGESTLLCVCVCVCVCVSAKLINFALSLPLGELRGCYRAARKKEGV